MKRLLPISLGLVLMVSDAFASGARQADTLDHVPPPSRLLTTDIGGRDLRFLTDALEYGLEQVFLAGVAQKQAQDERVKAIATVLAETQQEENSRIARLAALKNVTLSAKEAAAKKVLARKLAKLKGAKFDQAWIEEAIEVNRKAVANYSVGSESTDPEIKTFAARALPLAKEKLSLVTRETGPSATAGQKPGFRTMMSQPTPRQ